MVKDKVICTNIFKNSEEQKLNQEDDPSNPTHQKLNTDEKDDMLINQIIQNSLNITIQQT